MIDQIKNSNDWKNYHTHTYRCGHATGDASDYAAAALSKGVSVLGMSDHTPLPDTWWPEIRMPLKELENYLKSIDKAQELYPQVTLLKALECDYMKRYEGFYKDELLDKFGLAYLIGSVHAFPYQGEIISIYEIDRNASCYTAYAKHFVQAMETGLFEFMAHPDLFGRDLQDWDEEAVACSKYILEAAEELKIPLEINMGGYGSVYSIPGKELPYPREKFWETASDYQIKVVINSDAHRPDKIIQYVEKGYQIIQKYGLKEYEMQ